MAIVLPKEENCAADAAINTLLKNSVDKKFWKVKACALYVAKTNQLKTKSIVKPAPYNPNYVIKNGDVNYTTKFSPTMEINVYAAANRIKLF